MDLLFVALTLVLFGAGHAYIEACARLKGKANHG